MPLPIRLDHVRHRYDATGDTAAVDALNDVTLELPAGSFVVLMGPSGSGKSTLLNLIGAVDRPTDGKLWIGDTETSHLSERDLTVLRRTSIGFIFQFFNLIPTLNVRENIAFPLALQRRASREIRERVDHLLAAVGLGGRASHYPHQLSGGELQRVAIARAVVHQPGLILADEPTGNLDTHTGETILQLIASVHRDDRPTIVMATHSDHAASYGERVVRVVDGRISSE